MTDLLSPETDVVDTAERPAVADRPEHPGWASIPDEPEADEVIVRRNGRHLGGAGRRQRAAVGGLLRPRGHRARPRPRLGALPRAGGAHLGPRLLLPRLPDAAAGRGLARRPDPARPDLARDGVGATSRRSSTPPRRHLVRDGRLVLFPRELEGELAMLGPAGRRHARLTDRMLGAPFAMPLGLTTRVLGAARRPDRRTGPPGRRSLRDRRGGAGCAEERRAELDETRGRRRPPRPAAATVGEPDPEPAARPTSRGPRRPRARPRLGPEATQSMELPAIPHADDDVRHRRPGRARDGRPGDRPAAGRRPRAAAALDRPARRPDPDPPARHRGDRDRRLRAVRRRLLRARPPAHPGPGARRRRGAAARDLRRQVRRRADRPAPGLRGRARHRPGRPDPRHPGRPELVGDRRRRDDRRPGLVGGPAGDGPPDARPRRRRRAWPTGRPG